jgi:Uma2 family endonuclease
MDGGSENSPDLPAQRGARAGQSLLLRRKGRLDYCGRASIRPAAEEEVAMRGVMAVVPPDVLAERKRTGAHKFDEMWDGVLHMPPMPNFDHQNLEGDLEVFLRLRWARPRHALVAHQINVASLGGWPDDYRIPDLVLVKPERFAINRNEYFEGAPDVVVEIRSPEDESEEKLPFYAMLGVPEVWIIDRDTKGPTVYVLKRRGYRKLAARAGGWLRSPGTGVDLRVGKRGKLAVRMAGDEATREDLPQD